MLLLAIILGIFILSGIAWICYWQGFFRRLHSDWEKQKREQQEYKYWEEVATREWLDTDTKGVNVLVTKEHNLFIATRELLNSAKELDKLLQGGATDKELKRQGFIKIGQIDPETKELNLTEEGKKMVKPENKANKSDLETTRTSESRPSDDYNGMNTH